MPIKGEYVYRRKDGLWEARYVKEIDSSGKKKYGSVYAHSCKEAKAKRQIAVENTTLYQKPTVYKDMTVSQAIEEWLKINKCRLKPSTYQRYKSYYHNHLHCSVGKTKILCLSTSEIQQYAVERQNSGLSSRTVNSVLVFLRTCLKYAGKEYKLPVCDVIYLPTDKKEMRVFSREEQRRLVSYLIDNTDIYKFGILLTLYTGLRVGELCALQWKDIEDNCIKVQKTMLRVQRDAEKGTELIVASPKTRTSSRTIPIPSFLYETVSEFRDGKSDDEYVLATAKAPLAEPRVMQYKFKKYLKELKIQNASFHTLRHTFATRGVESGFDLKSLSEIMGHSGVQTTLNLYVHSSLEQKRSNMELLSFLP